MNEQEIINDYFNTIKTRLLDLDKDKDRLDSKRVFQRLMLYRKILVTEKVSIEEHNLLLAQSDLQRFGLIVKRSEELQVNSRIHKEYFNQDWVETQLQTNTIYKQILWWEEYDESLKQILYTLALMWEELISNGELEWVNRLVKTQVIENWETGNKEQHKHLQRIRDRIIASRENYKQVFHRLIIYSQIIKEETVTKPNQFMEDLLTSGLLVKNNGKIQLASKIYQSVFHQDWVHQELSQNPIYQQILYWSENDESLKNELYELVLTSERSINQSVTEWINELVQSQVIQEWEQGNKEYQRSWQEIRNRLLCSKKSTLHPALQLYKQILQDGSVEADSDSQESSILLRSKLVDVQKQRLIVAKHIYPFVFNRTWVERELNAPTQIQQLWNNFIQIIWVILGRRWLIVRLLTLTITLCIFVHQIWELSLYQEKFNASINVFKTDQLKALVSAIESGGKLAKIVHNNGNYLAINPPFALQYILEKIYEQNRFEAKVFHDGPVRSVNFSRDGKRLVSSGDDGSVRLWDISNPSEIKNSLIAPEKVKQGIVMSVSFSPTNNLIATLGWGKNKKPTIRLWDFLGNLKGEPVSVDDSGVVTSVTFSPDGQFIATLGGKKSLVKLWKIKSDYKLEERSKLELDSNNKIESVSFHPKNKKNLLIATSETNGIVKLWEQSSANNEPKIKFKPRTIIEKQQHGIKSVNFTPNGDYIATSGKNGTVILWNLQGKQRSYPLSIGQGEKLNISFTPDEKFLAITLENGKIQLWKLPKLETENTGQLWDWKDKKVDEELNGHEGRVYSINFSPNFTSDTQYLATGGKDKTVRLWNLSRLYKKPLLSNKEQIKNIVIGKVSEEKDQIIQRLAILEKDTVQLIKLDSLESSDPSHANNINISPDLEHFVTIENSGDTTTYQLWNFSDNSKQGNPWTIQRVISRVILSKDNKSCILFEKNGQVSIWEVFGQEYPFQQKSNYNVKSASFSPNDLIAAVLSDGKVRLWDLKGKIINANFISSLNNIENVEFSPNGKLLATIENNQTMKLWEIMKKEHNYFYFTRPHKFTVNGVTRFAFSPTGELIATAEDGKVIKLWDLSSRQIAEFNGDWKQTVSLSFTPDGKQIAAAGDNGTIELWDIKTLDQLLTEGCKWLDGYFSISIPSRQQEFRKSGCMPRTKKDILN